jgi:hypothetical protein
LSVLRLSLRQTSACQNARTRMLKMLCRKPLKAQFKNKMQLMSRFPFGSVKCLVLSVKCSKTGKHLSVLRLSLRQTRACQNARTRMPKNALQKAFEDTIQKQNATHVPLSLRECKMFSVKCKVFQNRKVELEAQCKNAFVISSGVERRQRQATIPKNTNHFQIQFP